ncbi:MAG: PLP-dependent aminotransferase family protein [Bryobacteraceae bacterium]
MPVDFTLLFPDDGPLQGRIYAGFRAAILGGRLALGERVPSTRQLARGLTVSRTTVTAAYERLHAEGYLETSAGSGTFVSARLPEGMLEPAPAGSASEANSTSAPRLSVRGRAIANARNLEVPDDTAIIHFRNGCPGLDCFPYETWRRLHSRRMRDLSPSILDYQQDRAGHEPLRRAIARYLTRYRAVRCDASQVVLVSGSQQALALTGEILIDSGDRVAVENPGYRGAIVSFATRGARLHPLTVDGEGALPAALPKSAKLVYLTPAHQFPTGVVMPLARRLEFLAWAAATDSMILEDDYDSEFRFEGRPTPSMQGLDRAGRVLYAGTFSKVLFPGLRLGYLVAPPALVNVLTRAKFLADRQCAAIDQLVLTDFLEQGHFERHVRRMRSLYATRRQTLADALAHFLGPRARIHGEPAGLHVMLEIDTPLRAEELLARALAAGVSMGNAAACYLDAYAGPPRLVLGFAALPERTIREGIRRLARALRLQ